MIIRLFSELDLKDKEGFSGSLDVPNRTSFSDYLDCHPTQSENMTHRGTLSFQLFTSVPFVFFIFCTEYSTNADV